MTAVRPRRTRVGKRNQVTIPAAMLRRLGVAPGESVEVVEDGDAITIRRADDALSRAAGMLHTPGAPTLSIEQMNELIRKGYDERAKDRLSRLWD